MSATIPTILFLVLAGLLIILFIGGLLHCADDQEDLKSLREMDDADFQAMLDDFEREHGVDGNKNKPA